MAVIRWRVFAVMAVAVLALVLGETAVAKGMKQVATVAGGLGTQLKAVAGNGWVLSGSLLLAAHLALYAAALSMADLSLAMPLTAASYPLGTLLARYYLREDVDLARWVGTLVIALGVALVAWGEARAGR
jgi:drug/metabolite transporter (DMT)-like permease